MIYRSIFVCFALIMGICLDAENGMGQSCIGSCGTDTANGVVTSPPGFSSYDYVTTAAARPGSDRSPGFQTAQTGRFTQHPPLLEPQAPP